MLARGLGPCGLIGLALSVGCGGGDASEEADASETSTGDDESGSGDGADTGSTGASGDGDGTSGDGDGTSGDGDGTSGDGDGTSGDGDGTSGDGDGDGDPCAVCDPVATCTPGTPVQCDCPTGYTGSGITCTDDDECAASAPCPASTTCMNTPGGFTCDCGGGYWFDGADCVRGGTTPTLSVNHNGAVALGDDGSLRRWGAFPDQAFTGPVGSGDPWTIDASQGWAQLGRYCAIKDDATLWCWQSAWAATGPTPTQFDGATDWAFVDALGSHACAIKTDGTLWCWGRNSDGEIGVPSVDPSTDTPVQVTTDTDWATVAVAQDATCAIKTNGDLWCWGATQAFGAPGSDVPVQLTVPGPMAYARPKMIGSTFAVEGLGVDGRIYEWAGLTSTATALGVDQDWRGATLASEHRCAIKGNGSLWCWGTLLHTGISPVNHADPTRVGTAGNWVEVSSHVIGSSSGATCARNTAGQVHCFGHNQYGDLGNGTIGSRTQPDDVVDPGGDFEQVAGNVRQTCGVRSDGTLACWGSIDNWDAPLVSLQHLAQTPETIGADTDWVEVGMGSAITCARKTTGTLWCWGTTSAAWTGLTISPGEPTQMGADADWTSLRGGETGACGLRGSTLYCWGNLPPWLGFTDITQVGVQTDWDTIDVGRGVCGLRAGELWCASGFGAQQDPEQVGSDSDWLTVTVGSRDVCGVKGASLPGAIWCSVSGSGTLGQVGNATDWMSVTANKWTGVNNVNCGIKQDGSLWCWGPDVTLATGDPVIGPQSPVRFGTENDYAYVAGGDGQHVCAVTTTKTVRCFGVDAVGMLGNDEAYSETLVPVDLQ
jgi:alpha-tubulin suppressor-like RCC1 family protein